MYVKCIYCKIRFVIEQHTNNCHNIRLKIFLGYLVGWKRYALPLACIYENDKFKENFAIAIRPPGNSLVGLRFYGCSQ